jgi:hypothetical protein
MRRPFHIERFERDGQLVGRSWWETDLAAMTDDEVYTLSVADPCRQPGGPVPEGEMFLAKAVIAGLNVGALYRALYTQWVALGGYAVPFDACTWPQALEYASKALPSGSDAQRHEWAIRYMWCLELPEPVGATP